MQMHPLRFPFPQIMFDTEMNCAIPLTFFTPSALRAIHDEGPMMPTRKVNPRPGESKGITVLDIEKLQARFGDELSLDFGQYTQVSMDYYRFQCAPDVDGEGGAWSECWRNHFRFSERPLVPLGQCAPFFGHNSHLFHWALVPTIIGHLSLSTSWAFVPIIS